MAGRLPMPAAALAGDKSALGDTNPRHQVLLCMPGCQLRGHWLSGCVMVSIGPTLYRSVLRSVKRLPSAPGDGSCVTLYEHVNPSRWGHGEFARKPTQPALLYLFGVPPSCSPLVEQAKVGSSGFFARVELNRLARRCFERSGGSIEEGFLALRMLATQQQLGAGASVQQTGLCRIECTSMPLPEDRLPPPGYPDHGKVGFVYQISVEHMGQPGSDDPSQLRCFRLNGRHWLMAEAGEAEEVIVPKGSPGVVGHTPTFGPGDRFVYASGTLISGEEATMRGSLQMQWLPPSVSAAAAAADVRLQSGETPSVDSDTDEGGEGEGPADDDGARFDAIIAPFKLIWTT